MFYAHSYPAVALAIYPGLLLLSIQVSPVSPPLLSTMVSLLLSIQVELLLSTLAVGRQRFSDKIG